MPRPPSEAAHCATMEDVRAGIDRVDAQLVALLAKRAGFIDRAAELKGPLNMPARIEWRVEQVVTRVRVEAEANGLDADLVEKLWRQLIEWSIAREEARLGPGAPQAASASIRA